MDGVHRLRFRCPRFNAVFIDLKKLQRINCFYANIIFLLNHIFADYWLGVFYPWLIATMQALNHRFKLL